MDEPEEPDPQPAPRRRWLGWALVALGAAGGLWLAALPLDRMLPEPRARRSLLPEPPAPGEPAPEGAPLEGAPPDAAPESGEATPPAAPLAPEAEPIDPSATPPGDWFEETPGEDVEEQAPAQEALRARLERQLQMNDLGGVRVEIINDRVVTSGALPSPGDRQRVALLIRSLAPDFVHEDQAFEAGGPP